MRWFLRYYVVLPSKMHRDTYRNCLSQRAQPHTAPTRRKLAQSQRDKSDRAGFTNISVIPPGGTVSSHITRYPLRIAQAYMTRCVKQRAMSASPGTATMLDQRQFRRKNRRCLRTRRNETENDHTEDGEHSRNDAGASICLWSVTLADTQFLAPAVVGVLRARRPAHKGTGTSKAPSPW